MSSRRLIRFGQDCSADPEDQFREDKRRSIRYLLDRKVSVQNPRSIRATLDERPVSSPDWCTVPR